MSNEILHGKRYGFLGGGIIAGVFVERLIRAGVAGPEQILATDIRRERLDELQRRFGIRVAEHNIAAAKFADILFVAVPPSAVLEVLEEVRGAVRPDHLLVSLAAIIPTWAMENALEKPVPLVRVIPNTPSLVGRGMNPYCLGESAGRTQMPLVEALLAVFGESMRLEEHQMNLATALTAIGPTYVFPVIRALKDAAMKRGMAEREAQIGAAHALLGAAQLVLETGKDPDALKTMIGTRTIKEDSVHSVIHDAFEEACERLAESEHKLVPVHAGA